MTKNAAWALAGNSIYAGCQWAVFVLIVKLLTAEQAGVFAYAIAITGPIFVFANLRLRNLLATSVATPGGFSDYLNARLLTTVLAVALSLAIGAIVAPSPRSFAVFATMAAGRACDAISEICHGLFQRALDMRGAAIGLSTNGLLSVGLVAAVLVLSRSLLLATAAYAAGSLVALVCWDLPATAGLRRTDRDRLHAAESARRPLGTACRLLRIALPLGLSAAIGSVRANFPRYVIASSLGAAMLAKFAAISYITMLGHLVVTSSSQVALPVLASDIGHSDWRYRMRLGALVAATILLGSLGVIACLLLGRPALVMLYGPEYGRYRGVLVWLLVGTVVTFASNFLGTGTTARQLFGAQFVITSLSFVVVALLTAPLVAGYGLTGAAWALLAGAIVEFAAYGVLSYRDLRGAAAAVPSLLANAFADGVRP